jgi:hypothetical protein
MLNARRLNMNGEILGRFAIPFAIASSCWAQLPVDIHQVAGPTSDRFAETERRLRIAQQSTLREAKTPDEIAAVDAAAKWYASWFVPKLAGVPQITTLTENGNDILIAGWSSASSGNDRLGHAGRHLVYFQADAS